MKVLTYEDWKKNPTPRIMWVWDDDIEAMEKRKVVYIMKDDLVQYPVLAVNEEDSSLYMYGFCAEIEEIKTRRMTHQEMSWWLQDGIKEDKHREWSYEGMTACPYLDYRVNRADEPVNEKILIRENGGEWHEPLVEEI